MYAGGSQRHCRRLECQPASPDTPQIFLRKWSGYFNDPPIVTEVIAFMMTGQAKGLVIHPDHAFRALAIPVDYFYMWLRCQRSSCSTLFPSNSVKSETLCPELGDSAEVFLGDQEVLLVLYVSRHLSVPL